MKLETSRNLTKSKRSLYWCRSISKKYLCTFYYSISQKVITLSGRRFITVSGSFITLSGSYYSIGHFYYVIGQLLQYRAFITLSVGTGLYIYIYYLPSVVPNKGQTTSPVDAAPSTDHLRGSMASLFWTMRREHDSRTMLWTYEWCVMAHARRRSDSIIIKFWVKI